MIEWEEEHRATFAYICFSPCTSVEFFMSISQLFHFPISPEAMPPHSTIHTTIASLTTGPPLVIAIIGGTSGIGSYIAKAFASVYHNSKSKLRVYIVGRNASRAETLLAEVRSTSPSSEWRFIKAHDLALMSDVDAICAQIKKYEEDPLNGGEPRIDMLYMTQAESPLAPSPRKSFPSAFASSKKWAEKTTLPITPTNQPHQQQKKASTPKSPSYTTPASALSSPLHPFFCALKIQAAPTSSPSLQARSKIPSPRLPFQSAHQRLESTASHRSARTSLS